LKKELPEKSKSHRTEFVLPVKKPSIIEKCTKRIIEKCLDNY